MALLARVVLACVIYAARGGALFLDDAFYSRLASSAADGSNSWWTDYDHWLYTRTGTLVWPLTGLYAVFGSVKLVGQFYVAIVGAGAAALTTRLATHATSRGWAIACGLIIALLPSQVLWASVVLKDPLLWTLLAAMALLVFEAGRSGGRRLLVIGVAACAVLVGIAYIRLQSFEIALVAMVLASFVGDRAWRLQRVGGALVLLFVLPIAFSMGPAGVDFVRNSGSLETRRENNALYAKSAVVSAGQGREQALPGTTETTPATPATPAPEEEATVDTSHDAGLVGELEYLPKGLAVVGLRPYPWETGGSSRLSLRLAGFESLLWYPLLVLAAVGLVCARRHVRVVLFPVLVLGAAWTMYGLTEGNLGTAYRHRGEFVWVVGLLAGLGAAAVAARLRRPT